MIYIPTGSELLNSEKILKKLDIKASQVVADLGCGTSGHFVFPSAKMVGDGGRVYAVDVLKSVLSSIESKSKIQNFKNVFTIWSDIEVLSGAKIADGSCDHVYLINVHAKLKMVEEALRLLKKGGKLLIIDWKVSSTPFGPDLANRVSAEYIKKQNKNLSITLLDEFDAGPYHWGLLYKK